MQGSLTTSYGLADVVRGIYVGRRSGILSVEHGGVRKQLYFQRGSFDFSDTNELDWRFGTLLVRRGRISNEDLDSVLRLLGPGKRIGRVLRDLGFLDDAGLAEAVSYQITENVYPVFSWVEGEFEFTAKEEPTPSDIAFAMSTANVIMEGVRRIQDIEFVRSALGPTAQVVSLGSNPLLRFQSIFLKPKEGFILSRIDGMLTVDEVCAISPVPEEDVLRCLYGLRCTGILEIASREDSEKVGEEADIAGFFTDFAGVEAIVGQGAVPRVGGDVKLTPAEEKERGDILEFAEKMNELDHYGVLGVAASADTKAIRKAYYALAKKYHPDRHHKSHLANLQDRLEAVFVRVNEAYETLKDEAARSSYDRMRARGGPASREAAGREAADPVTDAVRRAQIAESSFRDGKALYERHDIHGAVRAFQIAVQQAGDNALYRAWLGRALGRNPKWRREAEEHLMKAIELEPNVGEHYAQIGALYELANLHTRADRYFDEALRRDPDNETVRSARAKRGGAGTKPEKGDKPATKVADKAKGLFGRDRS